MNYLALARKWRPRSFSELVGQDHVVRALSNALETQRIHHAWLFTGTRGVGKTTLARILAKSLNCETGITANPCGQCSACVEIDQGRFVDYVEVDAASRRGVDEITPLLEQAIYAPSRGRFKIYTIDEVHMLTTHAFNAMLKTLEEPPAHLKFILATTDPQKIPVTVLSRCIQYNLKQMSPEAVVEHLQLLLKEEGIAYESAALQLIARGAAGSMRDALSLTDQAIAFSGNHITVQAMQDMLGTIDRSYLVNLINALLAGDASRVVALADAIAERGYSYEGALADLAVLLSRITMEQKLAGSIDSDDPLYSEMAQVVQSANHDVLHLFYTIAVHGRKELALAPDEYSGFVMICLRMLALVNAPAIQHEVQKPVAESASVEPAASERAAEAKKKLPDLTQAVQEEEPNRTTISESSQAQAEQSGELSEATEVGSSVAPAQPPMITETADAKALGEAVESVQGLEQSVVATTPAFNTDSVTPQEAGASNISPPQESAASAPSTLIDSAPESESAADTALVKLTESTSAPLDSTATTSPEGHVSEHSAMSAADWARMQGAVIEDYDDDSVAESFVHTDFEMSWEPQALEGDDKITLSTLNQARWIELTKSLNLPGLAGELLLNSQWLATEGNTIYLKIFLKNVNSLAIKSTLTTALTEYFSQVIKLNFESGETGDGTARAQLIREQQARQQQAEETVANDPYIQSLKDNFGAIVVDGSVRVLSAE